jgi:hypothetical protein
MRNLHPWEYKENDANLWFNFLQFSTCLPYNNTVSQNCVRFSTSVLKNTLLLNVFVGWRIQSLTPHMPKPFNRKAFWRRFLRTSVIFAFLLRFLFSFSVTSSFPLILIPLPSFLPPQILRAPFPSSVLPFLIIHTFLLLLPVFVSP